MEKIDELKIKIFDIMEQQDTLTLAQKKLADAKASLINEYNKLKKGGEQK